MLLCLDFGEIFGTSTTYNMVGFQKKRTLFQGPIIRIITSAGLYWGYPISGTLIYMYIHICIEIYTQNMKVV